MKKIELGEEIFDWQGNTEILSSSYFKIIPAKPAKIVEVITDTSKQGIIVLGQVEAIVDSVVYTKSHGAIGDTINFSGRNLVILGISITEIEEFIKRNSLNEQEIQFFRNEAQTMISKLQKNLRDQSSSINIHFNNSDENDYIIFGRRNFLLVGTEQKFVLIHKRQISIREGEYKLVQIDKEEGILIVKENKIFTIGSPNKNDIGSLLGGLGVNIASTVLDNFLWG